jgi:hypothetical protein
VAVELLKNHSIREFCDLKTPIIMFDHKGGYVALKLQEVGNYSRNPVRALMLSIKLGLLRN